MNACGTAKIVLAGVFMAVALGCAYKGGKVVEGTDLTVGISIPATEGMAEFNVLNYLSGFRLGIDRNAELKLTYTVAETNDYFGVIHTRSSKSVKADVTPVEVTPAPGTEAARWRGFIRPLR